MASLADLASSLGNLFKSQPQTFDYRSPERQAQEGPLVAQQTQQSFQLPQVSLPKFDVMAALQGAYNKIFPEDYSGIGKIVQAETANGIGLTDSGGMVKGVDNFWYQPNWPTPQPAQMQAMPSPTPVPQQSADPNFRFAFETLPRDQFFTQHGNRPNFNQPQPPANIGQIIRNIFPDEATKAAALAGSENARYEPGPSADNVWNEDGSIDRGIFAINSNTFNGELKRNPQKFKEMGINSFEDMFDPEKNAKFAKHLYDSYGAGRWFGWQDVGYDLNDGWYSAPLRGLYAEYAKTMSKDKAMQRAKKEIEDRKKK